MLGLATVVALLLAGVPSADESQLRGRDVYVCDFSAANDVNYDGWPDGWSRRRGRGFPHYTKIAIAADDVTSQPCLRIDLDGGGVTLHSPPIEIAATFSFLLSARLRTAGLRHNSVRVGLTFQDAQHKPIGESLASASFTATTPWQTIRIGPFTPQETATRFAVISLHVVAGESPDLTGSVWFDDLRFGQLPRMVLRMNNDSHLYSEPRGIETTCRVTGISDPNPLLKLELLDEFDRPVVIEERRLLGDVTAPSRTGKLNSQMTANHEGEFTWRPPLNDFGFYRVRVSMHAGERDAMQREITFAVLPPLRPDLRGEFGWSLPRGDEPLSFKQLLGLLAQVGINWTKFPVWHDDQDTARADRIGWFAERLRSQGIEIIGVLDVPPEKSRAIFTEAKHLPIASVFVTPSLWQPVLNPVMTRQSLSIRWWQLGADHDTSFVGYPQVEAKILEIRNYLRKFGQEVRLGLAWHWLHDTPRSSGAPWEFLSYTDGSQQASEYVPPLTSEELERYLTRPTNSKPRPSTGTSTSFSPGRRWVMLPALPRSHYDVQTRARDLVGRMLVAKLKRADGVFHPDPFDAEIGLMNADGSPGELLLPWRTTADQISGAEFIGRIQLPHGSHNYLFTRDAETLLVVWNDQRVEESLYLGENVRQLDLWGRSRKVRQTNVDRRPEQIIEVGPLPTFITGVNLPIAQMRMSFRFDQQELASIFGKEQTATYRFGNFFPQGVGGKVSLHTPDVWEVEPPQAQFKLAEGEERAETVRILLRPDASSGPQMVRADFDLTADRNYRFSVYQTLHVGLGDVSIEVATRLDDDGNLVVEQKMSNRTESFVSFNCLLFIPDRRRQRAQVVNLGQGQISETYVLPNGKELIGKSLWLRAEEIGGARVLNHRFIATE